MHLHDDHIGGILTLARSLDGDHDAFSISCLWLNTFQSLLAEDDEALIAEVVARMPERERYASAAAPH